MRCGVGHPGTKANVADYVLGDFQKQEQEEAKILIQEAADAVEEIVKKGPVFAMNKWNGRQLPEKQKPRQ